MNSGFKRRTSSVFFVRMCVSISYLSFSFSFLSFSEASHTLRKKIFRTIFFEDNHFPIFPCEEDLSWVVTILDRSTMIFTSLRSVSFPFLFNVQRRRRNKKTNCPKLRRSFVGVNEKERKSKSLLRETRATVFTLLWSTEE